MAPLWRNILLFAAVIIPSTAIPTSKSQGSLVPYQAESRTCSSKTPLQKLRDSIIEKIWDVPKRTGSKKHGVRPDHAAPANFRAKYGKDVVLRFKITTEDEAKAFSQAANILYLDVWDHSSEWVDVRIAKEMLPSFLNLLPPSLQNSHTPLVHDLAQSVYDTYPSPSRYESWHMRQDSVRARHTDVFFQEYQPLSVIDPWLRLQTALFPEHAEYFSIGKSAEGRDIPAIKVGAPLREQVPDDRVRGRKTILVVGGSHAREWISTSTAAYLAEAFAARYGKKHSPIVTKILKHYDIVFIPVLNVDGYEYTWSNDRFWRKNRQATSLPFCPGIDLDRAYGYEWDGDNEVDNPCSESYAGERPFQAVEADVLASWARNQTRDNDVVFASYLDLHSYSQKVLYPYSFSCEVDPPGLEDLEEVAMDIAKQFRLTAGHFYGVESACESQFAMNSKDGKGSKTRVFQFESNGGSSLDYFYEQLRVKWSFQIKLRDTGSYGFLLPKENIVPTGRETLEAVLGLGQYLLGDRGIESAVEQATGIDGVSPETHIADGGMDKWSSQKPEFIFNTGYTDVTTKDENDDDEWERVFDEELRKRR